MTQRIICPYCNCLCDDLNLEFTGGLFSHLEPPCYLAEKGFSSSLSKDRQPLPELNKKSVSWEQALTQAQKLIQETRDSLIVLSGEVSFETHEKAVQLGQILNACVDTPLSHTRAAIPSAINEVGLSRCSLGEMQREADMVIFWGCDLAATHPRFMEQIVKKGHKKKLFHIQSDHSERLDGPSPKFNPDSKPHLETAIQLRMQLKGKQVGLNEYLKNLLSAAQSAKFGVLCYGQELVNEGRETMIEVYQLIRDLNTAALWQGMDLHGTGNWLGASEALAAQTGYGCCVRFSAAGVHFQPSDWSTESMILGKKTDLVILIGDPSWLSPDILPHLADIPTILLSEKRASWFPEIWLPISPIGLHDFGTSLRMDEVPIQLQPVDPNDQFLTSEKILDKFLGAFSQ